MNLTLSLGRNPHRFDGTEALQLFDGFLLGDRSTKGLGHVQSTCMLISKSIKRNKSG